jgi:hypothetical protein
MGQQHLVATDKLQLPRAARSREKRVGVSARHLPAEPTSNLDRGILNLDQCALA